MSTSDIKAYEGGHINFTCCSFWQTWHLKFSWKDSEPQKYVISIALTFS